MRFELEVVMTTKRGQFVYLRFSQKHDCGLETDLWRFMERVNRIMSAEAEHQNKMVVADRKGARVNQVETASSLSNQTQPSSGLVPKGAPPEMILSRAFPMRVSLPSPPMRRI